MTALTGETLTVLHDQPKRLPTDPLSAPEAVFVANYNGPGTGTKAYMKAFPETSRSSAKAGAVRMLSYSNVRAHVNTKLEQQLWRAEVTADRIFREEAAIAFSSAADLMDHLGVIPPNELPEKVARAVKSFKRKIRSYYDKEGTLTATEETWEYSFWNKGQALRRLEEMIQMVYTPGEGLRDGLETIAVALNKALDYKYRKQLLEGADD